MSHIDKFEDTLEKILRDIDRALEEKHGKLYPLHPARPARGSTANPQYDGLFRVTACFSAGFGSEFGSGYIFRVELVTLASVSAALREQIELESLEMLKSSLSAAYPNSSFRIGRDNGVLKISRPRPAE